MEMRTPDAEALMAALDAVEAAWDKLAALPVHALGPGQVLTVLNRLEIHRRRQPSTEHALLAHLQSQATPKEMGAKSWRAVLSNRLGISGFDAGRRIAEAAQLGPRRAVTGDRLEPALPGTAAAQARGEIGAEHVTVIRSFMDQLPADVDLGTRSAAESQLSGLAGGLTPEGLRDVARQLMGYLDQDGTLDDEREHARKRGVTLGRQELDGMSRISGWIDPELRAALDAIFAKLASPGAPSQDQTSGDTRSAAQRTHDALKAVCRAMLSSGQLGQHNGLPVTIVATMTLADLTAAAGSAHTGGGTRLPIPFRDGRRGPPLPGAAAQPAGDRALLRAHPTHRGCSKPGCTAPAYHSQVHHAERDWQHGGNTDITELTLACGCDNRLVDGTPDGWRTRKRKSDNRTEWIPPPHLDRGQARVNDYHHPEEVLLRNQTAADDDPG